MALFPVLPLADERDEKTLLDMAEFILRASILARREGILALEGFLDTQFNLSLPDKSKTIIERLFEYLIDCIDEKCISDIAYYRMLFKVAGIHEYLSNNKDKIFSYFMSSNLLSQISDKGMRKNLIALIDFWLCGIFDVYYDSVLEKIPLRLDEVPSFCSRVVSLSSKGSLEFLEVFSRP